MSARIGDVHVRVGADETALNRGLAQAGRSVEEFGRRATRIATNVAKVAAAAASAAAAVGAVMVARAMTAIDANAKLAASLNTTTASLVTLQRAADLSGVENLNGSLTAFNRNLSAAVGGTGPAVAALDRMGLSAAELAALPLDERVQKIGSALLATVPAAEQAKVAADLFGRSGAQMLNVLRDSGVIAEARRQVEGFGLALSEVDVAKVELANDAWSSIKKTLEGVWSQVAVQLAPVIRGVALAFQEAAIETGGFRDQIRTAFDAVISGAGWVADRILEIQVAINSVKGAAAALEGLFWTVMQNVARAVAAAINSIINKVNMLFAPLNFALRQFGQEAIVVFDQVSSEAIGDFSGNIAAATARVGELRGELSQLMNRQQPSEALREWFDGVQQSTQEAAEGVAQLRAEMRGLIEGEDLEGEDGDEQKGGRGGGAAGRVRDLQAEITRAEEEAARERVRIAEEEARMKQDVYDGLFANIMSLSSVNSKKMFNLAKIAAIGQAALKAKESITSAYAQGMAVGGPVLAKIYAGTAIAATAAQIASLKSTSYGGGGGSGGGGRGGTASAATAAAVAAPSQRLTINLVGDRFSRDSVRELFEQINTGLNSGLRFERIQLR